MTSAQDPTDAIRKRATEYPDVTTRLTTEDPMPKRLWEKWLLESFDVTLQPRKE